MTSHKGSDVEKVPKLEKAALLAKTEKGRRGRTGRGIPPLFLMVSIQGLACVMFTPRPSISPHLASWCFTRTLRRKLFMSWSAASVEDVFEVQFGNVEPARV